MTVIIDNKSVIHRTNEIIDHHPIDYMTNEYDMLEKLRLLLHSLKKSVQVIWQPSHTNSTSLPASLNAKVDILEEVSSPTQQHASISDVSTPYSISEATIWMDKVPITSRITSTIRITIISKNIKIYLKEKCNWSKVTLTYLRFDIRESAMQSRSPYEVVQINKLLYNWAPVNSRLSTFTP